MIAFVRISLGCNSVGRPIIDRLNVCSDSVVQSKKHMT